MKNEQRYHLGRLAERIVTPTRYYANGICPQGNPFPILDEFDSLSPAEGDLLATMIQRESEGGRSDSRIKRAFIRCLEELGKQASSHPFF